MRPQSPVAFEVVCQITMWVLFLAAGISAFANNSQLVWLQITALIMLMVAASFGFYFARQTKHRKLIITPAVRKIRFASSTTFLVLVVGGLFVLALRANHSRGWTLFIIVAVPLVARFFWDMYYRKV